MGRSSEKQQQPFICTVKASNVPFERLIIGTINVRQSRNQAGQIAKRVKLPGGYRQFKSVVSAMFVAELGQHLAVSSIKEMERLLKMDMGFWNVISIREPTNRRPEFLCRAKRVHEALFEDQERNNHALPCNPPRGEHLAAIFRFVDAQPGEPILVHCQAGLSRSPAVALTLIFRGLLAHGADLGAQTTLVDRAVGLLLQIRPQSRPNVLVLQIGLEQFLPPATAGQLAVNLVNPRALIDNRFVNQRPQAH